MNARLLVIVGLSACVAKLEQFPDANISCGAPAECPSELVCVLDLGRCESRNNPCIQASGEAFEASDFGTRCDLGICVSGRCETSRCGDGFVDTPSEACDDGLLNSDVLPDACRDDCQPARCGDGTIDPVAGELCDDGSANADGALCSTACTQGCGDGHLQLGETCDDGNRDSGDGCDRNCTPTSCGNGVQTSDERCDDGNVVSGDGCDDNCEPTGCGNGVATAGEECDDGNFIDGLAGTAPGQDHCDHDCSVSRCGNAIISLADGEQCDDGNTNDGDGCSGVCVMEPGFVCSNIPSLCVNICGDGVLAGAETCDDDGTSAGDGCDAQCQVELGWGCGDEPSDCTPTWYVDESQDGGGDGLSWTSAFNTLQAAITQANALVVERTRQEIWVADGTYRPAGSGGDREATFVSLQDIRWLGGFAGGEARREARDPAVNFAYLSGDLNDDDDGGFASRTDNSCHVVTVDRAAPDSPLNTTQEIDGFIIEDGEADAGCDLNFGLTVPSGGGVLMNGRAIVRNSLLRNNRATGTDASGGALYSIGRNAPVRIYRSRIENNRAVVGAGVKLAPTGVGGELDPALVQDCVFKDNIATSSGGGLDASVMVLLNTHFRGNSALSGGAIIGSFPSAGPGVGHVAMVNVSFDGNTGTNGAAYTYYSPGGSKVVHCMHCTLLGDSVALAGSQVTAYFHRSIIDDSPVSAVGNTAVADDSFVNAATLTGTGNITGSDPDLGASLVPNSGSPVINQANMPLPQVQVADVCDVDRDNDRKAVRTYDFAKDPCDLDGDGNINEPFPLDGAGNPRSNAAPDLGAFER